jgi:hypothetical protein
MNHTSSRAIVLATLAAIALFQLPGPAAADTPIWANAKWVKATATTCAGLRYLILKGNAVTASTKANSPGCKSSEEVFVQVNVSKKFFSGNGSEVSGSKVDAGFLDCGEDKGVIILGAAGEAARAMREHPAPRGCSYSTRQYQYISSVGRIPFTDVANGGTMSVRESLAIHAKERARAIAECNADPACQAQVDRMRAMSGSGSDSNPCASNSRYPRYGGDGRCADSSGNRDPAGTFIPQ